MVFLLPFLFFLFAPQTPQTDSTHSVIGFVKPGTISVDDRSLTDWNGIKPVQSLNCTNQWRVLKCGTVSRPPELSRSDQIDSQGSFYAVWDGDSKLFFALKVEDDVVLSVPSTDKQPWRTDAGEVFFAAECEGQSDYHDCAQLGKPVFQLLLCPNDLQDKRSHLAEYRTPKSLIDKALQNGFQARGWKTGTGWQAEAVFPLAALDKVKDNILSGKKVKISFDVLDYDRKLARWEEPCWGFEPDNVISSVGKQEMASIPAFMSEFIFEAKK
jgi:hypothetical protein